MSDFSILREEIDSLIDESKVWIKKKSISESMDRIDLANKQLMKLKQYAQSDIQNRVITNRAFELEVLARKVDEILSKREAGKKEDGNIAFKCNWNDKYYKAPCSIKAYNFNLSEGKAWCCSPLNKCRDFTDEVSYTDHPCYESIALKEMYFGAGIDHTGDRIQPRHIKSVRSNRLAILTTRSPGTEEKDRLIIGCLFINKLVDDPGKETEIFGHHERSFEIDYDKIKIKFWDYYKNTGEEDLILWASGLFRYISNNTVLNILKGIGEQYKNSERDVSRIIGLIRHFEDLIKKSK